MEFYLSQVGNNFPAFHSSIVVFINQQWFNDDKDLKKIKKLLFPYFC